MRKNVSRVAAGLIFGATVLGGGASAFAAGSPVGDTPGTDVGAVSSTTAPASATGNAAVVVDGSLTLALDTADKSFTLEGVAGAQNVATPDNTISYIVTTNNVGGYAVSVKSDQANLSPSDTNANKDVIPFNDITATGTAATTPIANGGTSTGASGLLGDGTPLYSQSARSDANGDEHKTTFSANVPFVNTGEYDGTVTFTATAQ